MGHSRSVRPDFTIWVWFDALLTYITGIGYGDDEVVSKRGGRASTHFIGKDITRFHCALAWPAMLWAAGVEDRNGSSATGSLHQNDETGRAEKISKSLGNVVEPMDIITKFSSDAFRYYSCAARFR